MFYVLEYKLPGWTLRWDDAGLTYGQDEPALLWRRPVEFFGRTLQCKFV